MKYALISKEGFAHFQNLINYSAINLKGILKEGVLNLLYLMVSQINECPYCVDAHFNECLKFGIDARKLNSLCVWRDTIFFDETEKALLEFAEQITFAEGENDALIEELKKHNFSEKNITDIAFAIANMNALNRVAIIFGNKPKL
jgi:AhpD family alkylhydroperoxidase